MHHPRNRAERRRVKIKKEYGKDREFAVQRQLEQEAEELRKGVLPDVDGQETLDGCDYAVPSKHIVD